MQAFIKNGTYFELTDSSLPFTLPEGAVEVPLRPSPEHVWSGDAWVEASPPAPTKPQLLATLADLRWQRETAGVTVEGMVVPTDDRSKLLILGAVMTAQAPAEPLATRLFKLNGEFVTVTNAQLVAIGDAIAAHVQQCFDAESAVAAQIAAEEVVCIEDVVAAFDLACGGGSP